MCRPVDGWGAFLPYLAIMFIIDAHLDLSMNALEWNRDLTQPVQAIRAREKGSTDKPDRGRGTRSEDVV